MTQDKYLDVNSRPLEPSKFYTHCSDNSSSIVYFTDKKAIPHDFNNTLPKTNAGFIPLQNPLGFADDLENKIRSLTKTSQFIRNNSSNLFIQQKVLESDGSSPFFAGKDVPKDFSQ
ncbi:MAG: hypothetical protein ACP5OG_01965 [Candidatus Nanoarchaeia archaeon]